MELRQFKYLLSIAEEGTFTAAADKLYISQSALSQQVKSMEEELGVPLFDRSRNRVQFTQAGELLHQRALRIVHEVEGAKIAIDELEELCRGTLKVGVVQTVNAYLIPGVVSTFTDRFPKVQLQIEELSAPELERKIYAHEIDIGIGFSPVNYINLEFVALFEEELILIVNFGHKFSGKKTLKAEMLDGQKITMLPGRYCTRRIWNECASQAGIKADVHIEMNTIGSILSVVQDSTHTATILPALTMQLQAARGLNPIQLTNPIPKRTAGILWRNGGYRSMASKKFAEIVRSRYRHIQSSS